MLGGLEMVEIWISWNENVLNVDWEQRGSLDVSFLIGKGIDWQNTHKCMFWSFARHLSQINIRTINDACSIILYKSWVPTYVK